MVMTIIRLYLDCGNSLTWSRRRGEYDRCHRPLFLRGLHSHVRVSSAYLLVCVCVCLSASACESVHHSMSAVASMNSRGRPIPPCLTRRTRPARSSALPPRPRRRWESARTAAYSLSLGGGGARGISDLHLSPASDSLLEL